MWDDFQSGSYIFDIVLTLLYLIKFPICLYSSNIVKFIIWESNVSKCKKNCLFSVRKSLFLIKFIIEY